MKREFVRRVTLPVSAAEAFAWHERAGAFARLSPPWQRVQVLAAEGGIRDGAHVTLDLGAPIGRWSLTHSGYVPGRRFVDTQTAGPFAFWRHTHEFTDVPGGCELTDLIEYALPGEPFSALAHGAVEAKLDSLFRWRHRVTRLDLAHAQAHPANGRTVAIAGASGLVGSALLAWFATQGWNVRTLVRRTARAPHEIAWDPARGVLDPRALEGVDAVVNLAGAGIADAPWTDARKRELRDSRIGSTDTLARAIAASQATRVCVSASAIGYYGDRGDELLRDGAPAGAGFLAELAKAWEDAARPAAEAGVRVVHPRIGLVLWPQGGALPKLLTPARFGAGGPLGHGRQWWSWVTLHDLCAMIGFAIEQPLQGAFAAVSPQPVRQSEFAAELGRALARPAFAPAPAFALRALLGAELADAVLLAGQRLEPAALTAQGYRWRDPKLAPALRALLGRARREDA